MPGSCTLDSIQLLCGSDIYNHGVFYNAYIYACHTTISELDSTFDKNYGGNTPVAAMVVDTLVLQWQNEQWQGLGFNYSFAYNGSDNLILEFRWQGDDNNSVYDRGWYTPGNRAVSASSSTAVQGVPRNYMPRFRIFYSVTGIGEGSVELPRSKMIAYAYPNPFHSRVFIRVESSAKTPLAACVYNSNGRLVTSLKSQVTSNCFVWNGNDQFGQPVCSGIYFCRMATSGSVQTLPLVLHR
jgi:hypothetical protein